MGKENKISEEKKNGKLFRNGGYSIGLTVIVLVILIVINAVVQLLPANLTQFDLSPMEIFTLTDTTKDVIDRMTSPVTIYTIAEPGSENIYMQTYIELYAAESDKIVLDTVNPTTDIKFLDEFSINQQAEGSVVVVGDHLVCSNCGYETTEKLNDCPECDAETAEFKRKFRYIDINNTFISTTIESTGETKTTGIDIEGQLTSALVYVSTTDTKQVYYFTGHGEEVDFAPTTAFQKEIEKLNMGMALFNFKQHKYIPDDADIIILNGPDEDYDDEETQALLDFMEDGGSVLINIRLNTREDFYMPNYEKILATYGVKMAGGGVLESNANYYFNNQMYSIKPSIHEHDITHDMILASQDMMLYFADAIKVIDDYVNPNLTISPLITTSSSAYLKERGETTMAQAEDDEVGTFNLGVAIEEKDGENSTRLVVFSTHYIINDTFSEIVSGANTDMVVNSVSWLGYQDDVVRVSAKTLNPPNLIPTTNDMFQVTVLVVVIIPAIVLVIGVFVWYKRKKN